MARSGQYTETDRLFLNLAEQVKLPFVQILHESELLRTRFQDPSIAASSQLITMTSQSALSLIDGYLLSVQMQNEQQLELEPVSVSSAVYDVAESLDQYAQAHSCKLELHVAGKYGPVMANRRAVYVALRNLSSNFIEAVSAQRSESDMTLRLAVRKNASGVSTGIFSYYPLLSSSLLAKAKLINGMVHQPMAKFDSGMGSGVFVADALLRQFDAPLKVARFQGMHGLATTLLPSRQLNLI